MTDSHNPFLSQVAEQPDRLHDLASFYASEDGHARLVAWTEVARAHGGVLFSGMGTSEFAPLLVRSTLLDAELRVRVEDAGELYHYQRAALAQGYLMVLISQSGESIETRRLATECSVDPSLMVVLTNEPESTMAQRASLVLPMCAGHETTISTKTYVNTLALLYLMARSLSGDAALQKANAELHYVASLMAALDLDDSAVGCTGDIVRQAAAHLLPADAIQFVARGPSMVAARQAALTFMEGAKLPSTALTAGAFRHGPFELARKGHRVVFFVPQGRTSQITLGLAQECAEKGSHVVLLTDAALPGTDHPQLFAIHVPPVGESLFPLLAATPQAYLLHHVAAGRGFVAGVFDYDGKVTTHE